MVAGDTEAESSLAEARPEDHSRRRLLAGGALGTAAILAGCTSKVKQPSNVPLTKHTPGAKRDVKVLNGLLQLEYHAIAAYTACIPLLPHPAPPPPGSNPPPPKPPPKNPPPLELLLPLSYAAAQQFLSQELAHVTELRGFIHQAGGRREKPRPSYELGHPSSKDDVLHLLHRIEQTQLTAYLEAIPLLSPGKLRGAAAAIFANHAQHIAVWRFELGRRPVPSAFVDGSE